MPLLLTTSFLTFAIIIRIAIQYHYTGDHGVRLAKRDAPYIEVIPGTTFVISFAINMVAIALAHFEVWLTNYPSMLEATTLWTNIISALLGFSGIAITVVAQIQMGHSWRIGVDQDESTDLVINGLYSKSRNPIYFGILLYWIAITVSFPHPIIVTCALVCWVSIELIVRKIEEPYLIKTHGQAFKEYCLTSNRYWLF